ncbi:O-antigen ligase family protein [Phycicoccus avicenniae]|uniref:O-antigen ligase family protein n=1 Tax=Phycicoccus avicenniae TaxID=2828860 RepID=UPI003D2BABC8
MTLELSPVLRRPLPPTLDPRWNRTVTVGLVLMAVVASILSGYGLVSGQSRMAVLPLVAVAGLGLVVVAFTRFSWFVLLLLVVRASTDVVRFSGSDAGTTASNTVTARGLDPSSIIGVLFLVFALLWLAASFYERGSLRFSVVSTMLLAFLVAGALSVLGSDHPQASALQLARLTSAVMMFVVLERLITDRAMLRRVLTACFLALVVPLAYTVLGLLSGDASSEVKGGFTRLTGTFTQSNDYARFLTFLLLLGVAVLPYVGRRAKRLLAPLLAVAGVFLLLTLTLGAIGAAAVGVGIIALVQRRTRLLALLAVGGLGAFAVVPGLVGRLTESAATEQLGGGATGNSLSWRLGYWESLLSVNKANPVTGIGLNATQYYTESAKQPHNDYLSAYVETGIIGLVTYLGLVAAMLFVAARAVRRTEKHTLEWGVAVGAVVCIVMFAVMSVAANVIQSLANFWYVLAITACASAAGALGPARRRARDDDASADAGAGRAEPAHAAG